MNATQLTLLGIIVGGIAALYGIYIGARQNARDNERRVQDRIDRAVKEAVDGFQLQLTQANTTILRLDRAAERSQARIQELEDELRRLR